MSELKYYYVNLKRYHDCDDEKGDDGLIGMGV